MTSNQYSIGESWQALYPNIQEKARRGFSVASGCAVSVNTGTLGATDTISISSGRIWFGGSSVDVTSQNTGIDASDPDLPRKDVVYLDNTGTVQVAKGTASATPSEQAASRFEYYTPEPPDLNGTDAVVLAEIWVQGGSSSITSGDIADRRYNENVPTVLASQSITLSGGSTPAFDGTLNGVTSDQLRDFWVVVSVDADPAFSGDYAYNYDHSRVWDNANSQIDVDVTVNWDTDPGSTNDVSATVYVVEGDL